MKHPPEKCDIKKTLFCFRQRIVINEAAKLSYEEWFCKPLMEMENSMPLKILLSVKSKLKGIPIVHPSDLLPPLKVCTL